MPDGGSEGVASQEQRKVTGLSAGDRLGDVRKCRNEVALSGLFDHNGVSQ